MASNIASANDSKLISGFHSQKKVFRVHADGKVEQAFPPLHLPNHDNWSRVAQIVISQNQQKIAYIQDNDLWSYDVATKGASRLTSVGKPYTKEWASVEVLIKLWAMDESKILYAVVSGDTIDPEGYDPERKLRSEQYGLYVHDFKLGRSNVIHLPKGNDEPVAWLSNGDFLLHRKNNLARYKLANGEITTLSKLEQGKIIGQINVSHNGKHVLANAHLAAKEQNSVLIKLDLNTGKMDYITTVGKWAEYQWPIFSPSDKRIAYLHRTGRNASRNPIVDLIADDKVIYSYEGNSRFEWIDDSTIALIVAVGRQKELIVLDTNSGALKSKHQWE